MVKNKKLAWELCFWNEGQSEEPWEGCGGDHRMAWQKPIGWNWWVWVQEAGVGRKGFEVYVMVILGRTSLMLSWVRSNVK